MSSNSVINLLPPSLQILGKPLLKKSWVPTVVRLQSSVFLLESKPAEEIGIKEVFI